jgi:2'-5' RNA ligase
MDEITFTTRPGATGHTGAMIALIPTGQDAARLAMPGGEPVEELHVTLCYLGKAADYDIQERLMLAAAVAGAVEKTRVPVEGDAFATAYFNVANPDIETALVYLIGGEDAERLHRDAAMAAGNTFGPKIPDQHKPWVSHVTAAYTDDLDAHRGLIANLGRITFDRVRLAFGDQVYDIPLGVADDPPGEVESLGEDGEKLFPLGDLASGEGGIGEAALGVGEVGDDAVPVPEALPVQADIYAHACRADVDMPGLVAAMGVYAPVRWRGPLAPIGAPTGDRRIFAPGSITQATFPQPLRWQPIGMAGHDGAVTVAVISHAAEGTWNGTPHIVGEGYFLDPAIIPEVTQALHLVENGVSGPSVDLDSFAAKVGEYEGKPILVVQEGRQRAATLVPIPAFADLRLQLEYPEDDVAIAQEMLAIADPLRDGLVAATQWCRADGTLDLNALAADVDPVKISPEVQSFLSQHIREGLMVYRPDEEPQRVEFATTRTDGWQSAPIAPRSATFDADDAVKRIQAWAGIGTEDEDEAKFRSMFLWAKPEALDKDNTPLGAQGYRLPWGDIFDGKPYLVYHAVYAASALLEGGHGGLPNIPDKDKAQLRNTITKIYARFSEAFDDPNVRASWDAREEASVEELETFSAKFGALYPSKRAFARRDLKGPTKPVVSADGKEYYGHLALWDTCHLGHSGSGVCQKPVHSRVDYKHFYTGTVQTAEGEIIEVGKIMGDGDHAATRRGMSASAVKKYYENTSKVFGLVRLYKDRFGIQFSGVPAPWATEELAQKMRASEISAHWHPIDNHLEVVAAIAVNRPAFGITASATLEDLVVDESTIVLVEDGVQTGLIASAVFSDDKEAAMAVGGEGDGEDCGCGKDRGAELRAARIMQMEPIPTHAELQARQDRLSRHLGA